MKRTVCTFGILSLIAFLGSTTYPLSAQEHPGSGLLNELKQQHTLTLSPEDPDAREETTATLNSTALDLDSSEIRWYIDGSLQDSGVGKTNFQFQAPSLNTKQTLLAEIILSDGEVIRSEREIQPAGVTIAWEADTYTPPFYKGKPLYTPQSSVTIYAQPHFGRGVQPEDLRYIWRLNGKTARDRSGIGENMITVQREIGVTPLTVSVQVERPGSSQQASGEHTITPDAAEVLFYEASPLYGVRYNAALDRRTTLAQQELTYYAEPYFFSTNTAPNTSMEYEWVLNSEIVKSGSDNTITLRQEAGQTGMAELSVTARHIDRYLQEETALLDIRFGQ